MADFVVRDAGTFQQGNGPSRPRIALYRKFNRDNSLGHAWQTPSGFWIVSISGMTMDVAKDRKEASAMLLSRKCICDPDTPSQTCAKYCAGLCKGLD